MTTKKKADPIQPGQLKSIYFTEAHYDTKSKRATAIKRARSANLWKGQSKKIEPPALNWGSKEQGG